MINVYNLSFVYSYCSATWCQIAATARQSLLAAATVIGLAALPSQPVMSQAALYQVNGAALNGAVYSANGFTVTPDQTVKAGAVWRRQQVTLARSFAFAGNLYFGTKDSNGADGMTFTLQRTALGTSAVGDVSQSMGVTGISPCVSVEFDTYNNTSGADIADDHIAISKNGRVSQPVTFTTPLGGTATATPALVNSSNIGLNIENGTYYPVRITWNVKTKILQVYFNGALRATYSEDFVSTVFGNNPTVYYGVTGGTGGLSNLQEACGLFFDYDQDSDGLTDTQDADDDNDGITDLAEAGGVDATGDADGNGVLNYQDSSFGTLNTRGVASSLDMDGDGTINQFDLDSDSDGIPDVVEGTDGRMGAGFRGLYSAAMGQYISAVTTAGQPSNTTTYTSLPDTDNDGQPDFLDQNADNDSQPDWLEGFDDNSSGYAGDDFAARAAAFVTAGGSSAFYPNTDADGNGRPDWLDDRNSNGIPNYLDFGDTYYHDTDADGLVDLLDASNQGQGYAAVSGFPDRNANDLPDYRDVTVATPLPVTLVSFAAQLKGQQVLLNWVTASELNNAYFVPEVSLDGQKFVALGRVAGAGTSSQSHRYQYPDEEVARYASPKLYYRLRQVDTDGSATHSPVRTVAFDLVDDDALSALPNPFTTQLTLRLPLLASEGAMLTVTDATGRSLLSQPIAPGTTVLLVPQAANWAPGCYFLLLTHATRHYALKVVRQ